MADAHPLADPALGRADRNAGGRGAFQEPSTMPAGRQRLSSMPAGRISDGSIIRSTKMIRNIGKNALGHALGIANVGVPLAFFALVSGGAHAFTAPAAGDLGYDIYDIVVNKGVKGPMGFVGGVAAFLFGVSRLFSNVMIGIPTIVAAVCLIKSDAILQTFGMVI
jgi:hypothetical protein